MNETHIGIEQNEQCSMIKMNIFLWPKRIFLHRTKRILFIEAIENFSPVVHDESYPTRCHIYTRLRIRLPSLDGALLRAQKPRINLGHSLRPPSSRIYATIGYVTCIFTSMQVRGIAHCIFPRRALPEIADMCFPCTSSAVGSLLPGTFARATKGTYQLRQTECNIVRENVRRKLGYNPFTPRSREISKNSPYYFVVVILSRFYPFRVVVCVF